MYVSEDFEVQYSIVRDIVANFEMYIIHYERETNHY